MLVHALVASIGAGPEPTILLVLDRFDEIFADLVCRGPGVSVLAHNDLAQFLLVPILHVVLLLGFFLRRLDISRIGVQVSLGGLALEAQVVTEFTLAALLTVALLVENANNRLRIDTERNLLDLYRLEQIGSLLSGLLGSLLLGLTAKLLGLLLLFIGVLVGGRLRIELGDLSFGGTTFFLRGKIPVSELVFFLFFFLSGR